MAADEPRNQGEDDMTTQNDPMLRDHRRAYQGFIKLLTYSTIGVVVVLIMMALFLL